MGDTAGKAPGRNAAAGRNENPRPTADGNDGTTNAAAGVYAAALLPSEAAAIATDMPTKPPGSTRARNAADEWRARDVPTRSINSLSRSLEPPPDMREPQSLPRERRSVLALMCKFLLFSRSFLFFRVLKKKHYSTSSS